MTNCSGNRVCTSCDTVVLDFFNNCFRGLVVREISNGRQLLYLIYTGLYNTSFPTDGIHSNQQLDLKECDLEKDRSKVWQFEQQFNEEVAAARTAYDDGEYSSS